MKRIISVIMLVCLLMSLGTVSAFAAEPVQISNQQDFEDFMPNAPSGSVIELGAGSYTMVEPRFSVTIRYNSAVTTISGDSDKVTFEDTNNGGSTQPQNNNGGNNDVAPISDGEITDTASLQAALNAGGTVTLSRNITLTGPVTVPAGKSVTLNLNGCTVSYNDSTNRSGNTEMIHNYGNLTITGSGTITYMYSGASLGTTYAANTITSEPGSTITVAGGPIIENMTYDKGVIAYAIDGRTNTDSQNVTVNIQGGTVKSERQAIRIFANSTTGTGTLNISGGTIIGRVIMHNANSSANKAALNISGGTFETNAYKTEVLYIGGTNGATIDMNVSISDGKFNGEVVKTAPNTGFISGGDFENPINEEDIAPGFDRVTNPDGTYTVGDPNAPAGGNNGGNAQTAVSNPYAVPSTGDMSNMPLWGVLFLGFAVVAVLTRKREA